MLYSVQHTNRPSKKARIERSYLKDKSIVNSAKQPQYTIDQIATANAKKLP